MKLLISILFAAVMLTALPASAYDDHRLTCDQRGEWINTNDNAPRAYTLAFDKLGRGLENTLFGVLEIPKQTVKRAMETNCTSCYVSGFFKGIGYFIVRELAGVYEILTFPFPIPVEYSPVIDPLLAYRPEKSPRF